MAKENPRTYLLEHKEDGEKIRQIQSLKNITDHQKQLLLDDLQWNWVDVKKYLEMQEKFTEDIKAIHKYVKRKLLSKWKKAQAKDYLKWRLEFYDMINDDQIEKPEWTEIEKPEWTKIVKPEWTGIEKPEWTGIEKPEWTEIEEPTESWPWEFKRKEVQKREKEREELEKRRKTDTSKTEYISVWSPKIIEDGHCIRKFIMNDWSELQIKWRADEESLIALFDNLTIWKWCKISFENKLRDDELKIIKQYLKLNDWLCLEFHGKYSRREVNWIKKWMENYCKKNWIHNCKLKINGQEHTICKLETSSTGSQKPVELEYEYIHKWSPKIIEDGCSIKKITMYDGSELQIKWDIWQYDLRTILENLSVWSDCKIIFDQLWDEELEIVKKYLSLNDWLKIVFKWKYSRNQRRKLIKWMIDTCKKQNISDCIISINWKDYYSDWKVCNTRSSWSIAKIKTWKWISKTSWWTTEWKWGQNTWKWWGTTKVDGPEKVEKKKETREEKNARLIKRFHEKYTNKRNKGLWFWYLDLPRDSKRSNDYLKYKVDRMCYDEVFNIHSYSELEINLQGSNAASILKCLKLWEWCKISFNYQYSDDVLKKIIENLPLNQKSADWLYLDFGGTYTKKQCRRLIKLMQKKCKIEPGYTLDCIIKINWKEYHSRGDYKRWDFVGK